jgi:UrcA family protein
MNSFKSIFVSGMLLTLSAAAMPAMADESAAPAGKQITVSYADLDTSSPAGAAALQVRIASAAREACGPQPDIRDIKHYREFEACVVDSIGRSGSAGSVASN